jgi:hypothetical protein
MSYTWNLTERDDGWEVSQDRRVWIDQLTASEARDYVERRRKPDEKVVETRLDGYHQDITRVLRRPRQRA